MPALWDPQQLQSLEAGYQQKQALRQQLASQMTQQPQPQGNLFTHLLPTIGSVIGGVGGTLIAPVAGTAVGGAAGGAFGTLLENRLEGKSATSNLALNTGLGALGGIGKLAKGTVGATQAIRAGEGAAAAGNVLRYGTKGAATLAAEGTTGLANQAVVAADANQGTGLLGKMAKGANNIGKQGMIAQTGTMSKSTAESAYKNIDDLRKLGYSSFNSAAKDAPAITGENGVGTVARKQLVNNPALGGIDTSTFMDNVNNVIGNNVDLADSSKKNILALAKNISDKYNFEGVNAKQYGRIGISHPAQLDGAIKDLQTAAYTAPANSPSRNTLVGIVNTLKGPLDTALAPQGIGDNIKSQMISALKQQGVDNPNVLKAVQSANSYRDIAQLESKFVTASKVGQESDINALRGGVPGLASSGKLTLTGMLNQAGGRAVEKTASTAGNLIGKMPKTPGSITSPEQLLAQTAKSMGKAQALPAFARVEASAAPMDQSSTPQDLLAQSSAPGSITPDSVGQQTGPTQQGGPSLASLQLAIQQDIEGTGGKNIKNLMQLGQLYGIVDSSGQPTNGRQKLSNTQQTNLDGLNQAAATLGTYYQQLQAAGGGQGLAQGPVQSLLGKVGLGGEKAQEVRAIEQTRVDVATTLARAMTGNSRPAQSQINQWMDSIPNVTDPQGVAQQKLQNILGLIQSRTQVYQGASGGMDLLNQLNGAQ